MIKFLKSRSIFSAILLSCTAISTIASQTTEKKSEYSVTVLKNCNVVGQHSMTLSQISSYMSLKEAEIKMDNLEIPIGKINSKIEKYSDQIEELTELAFQHTDETFSINKKYQKQQELAVKKLNELLSHHQKDFNALGKQGRKIGKLSREFSHTIKDSFENIDFDSIRVSGLGIEPLNSDCYINNTSI